MNSDYLITIKKEKKELYKSIKQKKKFRKKVQSVSRKKKLFIYIVTFILYTFFIIFLVNITMRNKNNSIVCAEIDRNIKLFQLKFLTNNDPILYNGAEQCLIKNRKEDLCLYQFLSPKKVIGKIRILMGDKMDGCYVMLNDFENIKIAYSIGIRDIIQFDKALADKGIDVFMYDHTINNLPYENHRFHWKKIGIGGNSERTYNIQTLTDMLKENGHLNEKNMILKIDIEGAEWNSLNDVSEAVLLQFKYILIEYHFFQINPKLFYNVLKKIHKTHQVFYVHCCPFAGTTAFGNNKLCSSIEVSYIIRTGYEFTKDDSIYPLTEFSYGSRKDYDVNILKIFDGYKTFECFNKTSIIN